MINTINLPEEKTPTMIEINEMIEECKKMIRKTTNMILNMECKNTAREDGETKPSPDNVFDLTKENMKEVLNDMFYLMEKVEEIKIKHFG